uniref:Uncharacterized protein n=1 Tax=Rhizophora mucronata TaxID=61149 RepID=A0A2P2NQI2_RHIMU
MQSPRLTGLLCTKSSTWRALQYLVNILGFALDWLLV